MAVQDAPRSTQLYCMAMAQAKAAACNPARRLQVQRDWPRVAIIATQVLILIAVIGGWELAARAGWLDAFFWSQPSAIWKTLIIYFTEGDRMFLAERKRDTEPPASTSHSASPILDPPLYDADCAPCQADIGT